MIYKHAVIFVLVLASSMLWSEDLTLTNQTISTSTTYGGGNGNGDYRDITLENITVLNGVTLKLMPKRDARITTDGFVVNDGGQFNVEIASNITATAADFTETILEDGDLTLTMLSVDTEGEPLTVSITTFPNHGTLAISGSDVLYEPLENFFGSDLFQYVLNDGI